MKQIVRFLSFLVIGFLAGTIPAYCQSDPTVRQVKLEGVLPMVDSLVSYTEVVEVPGAKKTELQTRFRTWFAGVNQNAKDNIQLDDEKAGEMVIRSHVFAQWQSSAITQEPVKVLFVVKASFKDGKYRYQYTDMQVVYASMGQAKIEKIETWKVNKPKGRKFMFDDLDKTMLKVIANMKQAMTKQQAEKAKDW